VRSCSPSPLLSLSSPTEKRKEATGGLTSFQDGENGGGGGTKNRGYENPEKSGVQKGKKTVGRGEEGLRVVGDNSCFLEIPVIKKEERKNDQNRPQID